MVNTTSLQKINNANRVEGKAVMMMMIAFITFKSSLVPLFEGL